MIQVVQRWFEAQGHFRSIKSRTRLVTVLGLLALVLAGVSMLVSVVEIERNATTLRRNIYVVSVTLREMKAEIQALDNGLERLAQTPSPLVVRRFSQKMVRGDRAMEARIETLRHTFSNADAMVMALDAAYDAWKHARSEIVNALKSGDSVRAYTLAKTEGAGLIADLQRRLDQMLAQADDDSTRIWSEQERILFGTAAQQCAVLLLLLIIFAAIARFINQSIVRPTNEIGTAIRQIADGRLSTLIPHTERNDEIGQIAQSAKVFLEHAIAVQNSNFDILTELPTRSQLSDHMQILEMDPDHAGSPAAVLHIDLDGFSEVNSGCGRSAGDDVLVHVAEILRKSARLGDFVARDGPDSFVLIAAGRTADEAVETHAKPIRGQIANPVEVDGNTIEISCCIGIADYAPGVDLEMLLGSAEQALAEARRAGKGAIAIYTDELDARLQTRRQTLSGLRFALSHDEIIPYFQPQVDTATGLVTGMEALVRWNHPEHGVLAPWQFLGIAEEAGFGTQIMETMTAKAMQTLASWRRRNLSIDRISLNFAATDLRRADFADRLSLHTERFGLRPEDICVEVLESAMIEDADDPVSRTLDRLGDLGFPIELDDFGTGHAAVSTFNLIELNGVKIDRSFVTRLHERPDNLKVVRGMLLIANAMGVTSIAEGVESVEERRVLGALGCDVIQGFLISAPMSANEATDWLETYRPLALDESVAQMA